MTNWKERADKTLADSQSLVVRLALKQAQEIARFRENEETAGKRAAEEFDNLAILGDVENINDQVWEGRGSVTFNNSHDGWRSILLEAKYPSDHIFDKTEDYRKRRFGSHFKNYRKLIGVTNFEKSSRLRVVLSPGCLSVAFSDAKLEAPDINDTISSDTFSRMTISTNTPRYNYNQEYKLALNFPLELADRSVFRAFIDPALLQSCIYMREHPISQRIAEASRIIAEIRSKIGTVTYVGDTE